MLGICLDPAMVQALVCIWSAEGFVPPLWLSSFQHKAFVNFSLYILLLMFLAVRGVFLAW